MGISPNVKNNGIDGISTRMLSFEIKTILF